MFWYWLVVQIVSGVQVVSVYSVQLEEKYVVLLQLLQAVHTTSEDSVQAAVMYVDGGLQVSQPLHTVLLCTLQAVIWYLPLGQTWQAEQTRSEV